ncbi:MAG: HEAT repeat domain-containing protein, partial [Fimbriimonadales bacterium]
MEWQGVELEVEVPCSEGRTHPVRLRFTGWDEYQVVHNPCGAPSGDDSAQEAPCVRYLREEFEVHFHQNVALRRRLVKALGQADESAVPVLLHALVDTAPGVRRAARDALAQIGAPAVPPLIRLLRTPNASKIRRAAFWALVRIGAPAAPALIKALGEMGVCHEA